MSRARCFALLFLFFTAAAFSQSNSQQERTFPADEVSLKSALKDLGAYTGGRLPTLVGFVADGTNLGEYQHPYYDFKIETVPQGDKTLVRVKANVSAWYADGDSGAGLYRTLPSNGRLESDLLDRLKAYLTDHMVTLTTDTAVLNQHIATMKQERAASEKRITALKQELETLQRTMAQAATTPLVAPVRTNAAVYAEPVESSDVRLRAGIDDQFEVVEERGSWYRVMLSNADSGWIAKSQVHTVAAKSASPQTATGLEAKNAFIVTREQMFPFAGEWRPLKNKDALFLFVKPNPAVKAESVPDLKLRFLESLWAERFGEMSHDSSSRKYDGIVVIFLDKNGGVAAATILDIKRWREGQLSKAAFLAKCSLDPMAAFKLVAQKPTPAREKRSARRLPVAAVRTQSYE